MSEEKRRFTLYNGVSIPNVGFGTFRIDDPKTAEASVTTALEAGYRHIDTAKIYGNEEPVGEAIKKSGIPRNEIFLTSKLWNNEHGYHKAIDAFEDSLRRLSTDYLDLYLIHWPKESNIDTWKAFEKLYRDGRIRSIGVSNFKIHHLQELIDKGKFIPMVNQVELHPQFPQKRLRGFCEKYDILIESWGPLMQGKIFSIPLMNELAEKYKKTVAQLTVRWHLQQHLLPLPKSTHAERIQGNLDVYDFSISDEDMEKIDRLRGDRIGPDPDSIDF